MKKRTNQEWLSDLKSHGDDQSQAIEDLRIMIQRGLEFSLQKWLSPSHPQYSHLIEDSTQETLIVVLEKLDNFRGKSQFFTWVSKIAIHEALSELRRKRWLDASIDERQDGSDLNEIEHKSGTFTQIQHTETNIEQLQWIDSINQILNKVLTNKQKTAINLVFVKGMPKELAAEKMKTNRNALYKLIYDARKKIKMELEDQNINLDDILSSFE